ncbi:hypothetical protein BH11BAC7_BH11BAC7_10050 [soil metagenome]
MAHDHDDHQNNPDLSEIIDKVNKHVDTRMTYGRLLISEQVAIVTSKMGTLAIVLVLFLLFFLFTNIAAALWLGKYFDNYSLGFGVVSLFYLLAAVIYLLMRKPVFEKRMQDTVINALYPEKEGEDEDE